ncbi:hypothetical protein T01_556 [Trichinella spiralis]|uniref:Uncharacterized protein n=1 Tax=Trichinella spiralis TaxID=6334 RepID=A0A0V1B396_TRISP|nr:hypothetical protein T01_556 [Trichinella spiralis]
MPAFHTAEKYQEVTIDTRKTELETSRLKIPHPNIKRYKISMEFTLHKQQYMKYAFAVLIIVLCSTAR